MNRYRKLMRREALYYRACMKVGLYEEAAYALHMAMLFREASHDPQRFLKPVTAIPAEIPSRGNEVIGPPA